MDPSDLLLFALSSITAPNPISPEASYRHAVSASYYALFHRLARASAEAFSKAGPAASSQVVRAFRHTDMRQTSDRYSRWSPKRALEAPFDLLVSTQPDPRLLNVAASFVALQEARESADYDLVATWSRQDTVEQFQRAYQALQEFDAIAQDAATQVFLTALLMADRWGRRG